MAGTWDILFDQSLVVSLNNGYRYTADLRYNLKPDVSPQHENLAFMNEKQKQLFDMNCGETMVGFVQKKGSHKT